MTKRLFMFAVLALVEIWNPKHASANECGQDCWASCASSCGSYGYPVHEAACCQNTQEGGYSCYCDCWGGSPEPICGGS
jgi:hypothetical protein